MSRSALSKDDLELDLLRETELELTRLQQEIADIPRRLAEEKKEWENTMPPLAEIEERRRRREYDQQLISRKEFSNVLRDQNRSVMLLLLLITATGTMIWWGMKLMHG